MREHALRPLVVVNPLVHIVQKKKVELEVAVKIGSVKPVIFDFTVI